MGPATFGLDDLPPAKWDLKLTNKGGKTLRVESLPELAWKLPPGKYELTYLWGGWGQEKQVATEEVGPGRRVLASTRGRSTSIYSPWFYLRNKSLGVGYAGELAYSGNWQLKLERLRGTAAIQSAITTAQEIAPMASMSCCHHGVAPTI